MDTTRETTATIHGNFTTAQARQLLNEVRDQSTGSEWETWLSALSLGFGDTRFIEAPAIRCVRFIGKDGTAVFVNRNGRIAEVPAILATLED